MKNFALKTLILTMSAVAVTTANAGYINVAIPHIDFTDTVWENGITPNSHGNQHVVDNTYSTDGSDTDPNRVTTIDVHGAERITSGVSSSLITGYSNQFTDVSPAIVYGVKNKLDNVVAGTIAGSENKINGLAGGAVFGTLNNIETKHGDSSRSVFVLGSYNDIKSGANAIGRNITIGENAFGSNAIGNSSSITAKNGVAVGNDASVTAENAVALGKGSVANKANTVSVGSAGNERQITNVKAGTADTDAVNVKQLKDEFAKVKSVDVSGKADKTYVDSQNKAQDTAIAGKADKSAVDAKNATQDKEIAKNTKGIGDLNKSQAEQDKKIAGNTAKNTAQDGRLDALEAKNVAQDTAIAGKADKSAVDAKNATQDKEIAKNTKGIDSLNKSQVEQDKLIASKADKGYVDNSISSAVSSAVSGLANYSYVDSAVSGKANRSELEALDEKLSLDIGIIKAVNVFQDEQIKALDNRTMQNTQMIANLAGRVDGLEKNLSGGIAGSVAIGMMPTATEAGVKMVSGGVGHHNGETAVAVGFTGTTQNGKYSFKLGSSYATNGGATFGGGVGYRF